jgi:hypothetical protein
MDEVAALPSPRVLLSRRLKRYYGRPRHPPGSPSTSRLITGYRTRRSDRTRPGAVGPGRVSQVPVVTLSAFRAPYAGRFLGAASRLFTPSMAFAVTIAARLLLFPTLTGGRPNDAAGFA